jgi:peroxiredoxin
MKKTFFSWLTALPFLLHSQQHTAFTVNGSLKLAKGTVHMLYLSYLASINNRITDSAVVKDNTYSFSNRFIDAGKATITATYEPCDCNLGTVVPERDVINFFLEPGVINITSIDSFANATIHAGKANDEFSELLQLLKPVVDKEKQIEEEFAVAEKNHDSATLKNLDENVQAKFDAIDGMRDDVYYNYAKKNLNSPIALYSLQGFAHYDFKNVTKVDPLFNQLSAPVRNSSAGIHFKERIEIAKNLLPGKLARNFSQTDTADKLVNLASFRGKYVLVNFWASWCPHCRKENPNLVRVFNKYKDKPFTILSVSVDRPGQKENWLQAIRDAHLTWTHVSDLKFWDNEVAKQYGITGIPQNFLIDPQGKIVARNLMGERLDGKLTEIFAK